VAKFKQAMKNNPSCDIKTLLPICPQLLELSALGLFQTV